MDCVVRVFVSNIMKAKKKDLKLELSSILDRLPHLERDRMHLLNEYEMLRMTKPATVEKVVEIPTAPPPNGSIAILESEVIALRNEVASLEASRKDLLMQNDNLKGQLHGAQGAHYSQQSLISERDSLKNRLTEAERFISELQATKNNLMIQIESLTKSNSEKNRIVAGYMNELTNRNQQFERSFYK